MKCGLIMPVCCRHDMQEEAWTTARRYSRPETPLYVLFNGIEPWSLPDGIQAIYVAGGYTDEADLWNYGLGFAIEQGWDWVFFIHDDFSMREPGWETEMEKSEGWRVALAGWFAYTDWNKECVGQNPAAGHLATCIDPLSIGFNVAVFQERGYIALPEWGFGFGAWDVNAWALSQGYAVWRIPLDSWHHWLTSGNTRNKMNKGAPGHPQIGERWKDIAFPCRVLDGEHIEVVGQTIRVAPEGQTVPKTKRAESRSTDCTYVTGE